MMITSKVVLSFAAGALVASGIVYVALRPSAPSPHIAAAANAPATAPVQAAEPAAASAPVIGAQPAKSAQSPQKTTRPSALVAQASPAPDEVPASVRTDPNPPPVPMPPIAAPPAPAPEPEPAPEQVASEPATPEPASDPPPTPAAPAPAPNRVTIAAGTVINVRLAESLSTDKNEKGDTFFATLDQPLIAGGFAIAERGARVEGKVVDAVRGGRGGATAHLIIALTRVHTSDGQHVAIETTSFDKPGESSGGENAAKVGGGAVLGAIIGAAAGGGRGAGIGAAAGAGVGAGGVLLTRGRAASLPTETRLSFRLQQAVTITEQGH